MKNTLFEQRRAFLVNALAYSTMTATGLAIAPSSVMAMGKIPKQLVPGKSVYEFRGPVSVDGKPVNKKTQITPNSLVETGSNGFIVFVVGKDAHILRENSRVQFSGDTIANTMRVITGKLLSVFGHRTSGQRPLELSTTTATIGIRGTGVYTEATEDSSYLCTCYGRTVLTSNSAPEQSEDIISMHHDAPRFILAEPENGKHIIPAPVFNHTDEELMLVEAIVGRQPPFGNINEYKNPTKGY